jgi:hypothetical protein
LSPEAWFAVVGIEVGETVNPLTVEANDREPGFRFAPEP